MLHNKDNTDMQVTFNKF